ncbi:acetate--CoA ligase family protein [Desulfosarcina ovata]|uniref:Acetyl-CoA synthetase n=1 Tax=Desulfosarcina ovata subsp. ovata TaxID=2752305 RepID=A0A5K8A6B5_9BACT|nr:acetate--CoA ligase family protein [Desulfosarcina ovata]BBO88065.1 acetyl-CoA synthetase [Desulfosarcina ovata subsp. ovata]
MDVIEIAISNGQSSLSEYESKQILSAYQIPVVKEILVDNYKDFLNALEETGYPLVLKGCSFQMTHKTERNLIKLDLRNENEATQAYNEIIGGMDGKKTVLVQEMVKGTRELVMGLTRDPQFGPIVMFGLGGIFTEILKDVSFRLAPLEKSDALDMMREIKGHKILEAVRGMVKVDIDILADILINVGKIGLENEKIKEIDINPLIISGSKPIAVDALMILE